MTDEKNFTDTQAMRIAKEIAKAQGKQENRRTFGIRFQSRWQRTLVTKILPLAAFIGLVFGCDKMRAFLLGQIGGLGGL